MPYNFKVNSNGSDKVVDIIVEPQGAERRKQKHD